MGNGNGKGLTKQLLSGTAEVIAVIISGSPSQFVLYLKQTNKENFSVTSCTLTKLQNTRFCVANEQFLKRMHCILLILLCIGYKVREQGPIRPPADLIYSPENL